MNSEACEKEAEFEERHHQTADFFSCPQLSHLFLPFLWSDILSVSVFSVFGALLFLRMTILPEL